MFNKNTGFTLIESIVTVIILSSMVALAIPFYLDYTEREISREGERILLAVLDAQKAYRIEKNIQYATYASPSGKDINLLDLAIPTSRNFNIADGTVLSEGLPYAGSIARNGNSYTLYIRWNGQIDCSGEKCTQLKYPPVQTGGQQP